ncbi:MAG: hypothetical protein WKF71_11290 [Pyrinomonadaceae bacterium]
MKIALLLGLEKLQRSRFLRTATSRIFCLLWRKFRRVPNDIKKPPKPIGDFCKFRRITDTERRDRIEGLIKFLNFLGNRQAPYSLGGASQTKVPFKLINDRPIIQIKTPENGRAAKFRSRYRLGHFRHFRRNRRENENQIGRPRRFGARHRRQRQI